MGADAMPSNELEDRLDRLHASWPVGSIVNEVMSKLDPLPQTLRPRLSRHRLVAAVAASGLIAAMGLAWVIVASTPRTLFASVRAGLVQATSAHLIIIRQDESGQPVRSEVWYRRDEGLRAETPDQFLVDDGRTQWSWDPRSAKADLLIVRQNSSGSFVDEMGKLLALEGAPINWTRDRAPEFDAEVNGHPCLGFVVKPPAGDPDIPQGAKRADPRSLRVIVLAEAGGKVFQLTHQLKDRDKDWEESARIVIEYDVPVPRERIAANLPKDGRIFDPAKVFDDLYPLDRAIHRVELGGLILAVHDLQPLTDREGFFVVSSVRGTSEHLKKFPPYRRRLNPRTSVLEVATQPLSNGNLGAKYDRITLGFAAREGVEYAWWIVLPRKFYRVKDGKKVYEPENDVSYAPEEPGRLDDLAGFARVPLSAIYNDPGHRDQRGVPQSVSTWTEVRIPADRPLTTLEDVAGRTRRDMTLMKHAGTSSLLGVASDNKPGGNDLRPLSHFVPEKIDDPAFAAAVRRGLEDLREYDKLGDVFLGGPRPPE